MRLKQEKNRVQQKHQQTHLTPTGLLREGVFTQNPRVRAVVDGTGGDLMAAPQFANGGSMEMEREKPGEPVPTVDIADLRTAWEYQSKLPPRTATGPGVAERLFGDSKRTGRGPRLLGSLFVLVRHIPHPTGDRDKLILLQLTKNDHNFSLRYAQLFPENCRSRRSVVYQVETNLVLQIVQLVELHRGHNVRLSDFIPTSLL